MNSLEYRFKDIVFRLIQGDITTSHADAIVNAANSRLAGGGGVDGAIHRAAGPELLHAGQEIVRKRGLLPPGQAVITPGFHLAAGYVIHTVGPVWQGGMKNEPQLLASCYRSCLELARVYGMKTLAFSAVSCGVYGYPHDQAARIALSTLFENVHTTDLEIISVYLFSAPMFLIWRTQLYALTAAMC